MALELSLYHLAEGGDLLELFEMRADLEAHVRDAQTNADVMIFTEELRVVDEQITQYLEALPKKVDGVRAVWRRIETLIAEASEEMLTQRKRKQHFEADLERLKDYCQRCMELIEWKPGKPRKLEGHSGAIYLKGNGGRPGVEVYDESLVPDDLCTVTVTMNATSWAILASDDAYGPALRKCQAPRVPSLSLISARLSEACPKCSGVGYFPCSSHGGDFVEVYQSTKHKICGKCGDEGKGEAADLPDCQECGGSGKQSVPGARMKPVGQHVECR